MKSQSLLEIVLSLGILATFLPAISILILEGYLSWIKTNQLLQAIFLAKEGIEASILVGQRNWGELSAGEHGLKLENGTWSFFGNEEEISFLKNGKRKILIEDIDPDHKKITSKVSFEDQKGQKEEISFFVYFTFWQK
jgi:type II secretory pathway pseudopilin PulG